METTGQKHTKCYIGFYDFTAIQGSFLGWLVKFSGFSNITHTAPIFDIPGIGEVTITICQAKKVNGYVIPVAKVHKLEAMKKLGAKELHRVFIEEKEINLEQVIKQATTYADSSAWDVIFYNFVGQFLGLTRPRACTSYVCSLFNLREKWHPAALYRSLK